jgi:hypothetical protein
MIQYLKDHNDSPIVNRLKRHQENNLIHNSLSKKIIYLGINLTKEVKDPYNENCKTLKRGLVEWLKR